MRTLLCLSLLATLAVARSSEKGFTDITQEYAPWEFIAPGRA